MIKTYISLSLLLLSSGILLNGAAAAQAAKKEAEKCTWTIARLHSHKHPSDTQSLFDSVSNIPNTYVNSRHSITTSASITFDQLKKNAALEWGVNDPSTVMLLALEDDPDFERRVENRVKAIFEPVTDGKKALKYTKFLLLDTADQKTLMDRNKSFKELLKKNAAAEQVTIAITPVPTSAAAAAAANGAT